MALLVGAGATVWAGQTCGTISQAIPATGGELAARIGAERGEIDCESISAVVGAYLTSPELCKGRTNTCLGTVDGWQCSIPTAGSLPVSLRCEATASGRTAVGLDANALRASDRQECPVEETDGPVDITAKFDCQAAANLARTLAFAPCGDGRCVSSGFGCRTEPSGFDTRVDYECRFADTQLEFRADPEF